MALIEKILAMLGPLLEVINNIFKAFKKSPTKEIEDENTRRQKEIDQQIEDARNAPKQPPSS